MRPLETNKVMLKWLYLYPTDESTSVWRKLAYLCFSLNIFGSLICTVIASVPFVIKYKSTDLENCLFALSQMFACSNMSYMVMIAFFMRHKIADVYKHLAMIYDASK